MKRTLLPFLLLAALLMSCIQEQPGAQSVAPEKEKAAVSNCSPDQALNLIMTRRSIRKYTSQPVSDELVKKMLEAAMEAPSAGSQQPWHFVVIRDRKMLDTIPQYHPYADMLKQAALAILVVADTSKEVYQGYFPQDCSAATENLLLAAHMLGLGAVWLGIFPDQQRSTSLGKLLGIPGGQIPFALVSIGWPAEKKDRGFRYDPTRVHLNDWNTPWQSGK